MRKVLMTLFGMIAVALMSHAAFAQGQTHMAEPVTVTSLGDIAFENSSAKVLPQGFHEFEPHPQKGRELRISDPICHQWEKVLSLQKKLRELVTENDGLVASKKLTHTALVAQAVESVNKANRAKVCETGTFKLILGDRAIRGYTMKGDDHGPVPVEIISLTRPDGRIVYGGKHL